MIFVFPGQGSQAIGMGKDIHDAFPAARDVFNEVDDAISFSLSNLIFNGTEEELKSTENTQPALMAVGMAFLRVLEEEFHRDIFEKVKYLGGHSLGEYTALCASGVISLADTAKILRVRGLAMATACPVGGGMAAILGLDLDTVEQIVAQCGSDDELVQIANDNSAGQVVLSGHRNAVARAMEKANAAGAKRSLWLEVSGPFHSKLMENAVVEVSEILEATVFHSPRRPIISNVTARSETDGFKELLRRQITGRVRWRESIIFAESNSVSTCVEIGPGKVLTGLVKRIAPTMEAMAVNSIESLENFAKLLA